MKIISWNFNDRYPSISVITGLNFKSINKKQRYGRVNKWQSEDILNLKKGKYR